MKPILTALWLLLAATSARAEDGELVDLDTPEPPAPTTVAPEPKKVRTRKVYLPPLRVDGRTTLRDGVAPGGVIEIGIQAARSHTTALDLNVAYQSERWLREVPFMRGYSAFDFTADVPVSINRWLRVGPTGGLSYRLFRQQWNVIDDTYVPILGLRADTAFIRARTWSIVLGAKLTTDLSLTRMVMETAEVRSLHPIEGQVGLRMNIGHGKDPGPKEKSEDLRP